MRIKAFIGSSVNELERLVNSWLEKNSRKIDLHDIKVQSTSSGSVLIILLFNHYAVEEIED